MARGRVAALGFRKGCPTLCGVCNGWGGTAEQALVLIVRGTSGWTRDAMTSVLSQENSS